MTRRLIILVFSFVCLLLPVSRLQPGSPPVQIPPGSPTQGSQAAPAVSAEEVIEQVNAFYVEYWKAWDERDIKGIEAGLHPDFVSYLYVPPQGLMQASKEASITGVRQFLD